jgi:hypothetical protein
MQTLHFAALILVVVPSSLAGDYEVFGDDQIAPWEFGHLQFLVADVDNSMSVWWEDCVGSTKTFIPHSIMDLDENMDEILDNSIGSVPYEEFLVDNWDEEYMTREGRIDYSNSADNKDGLK